MGGLGGVGGHSPPYACSVCILCKSVEFEHVSCCVVACCVCLRVCVCVCVHAHAFVTVIMLGECGDTVFLQTQCEATMQSDACSSDQCQSSAG